MFVVVIMFLPGLFVSESNSTLVIHHIVIVVKGSLAVRACHRQTDTLSVFLFRLCAALRVLVLHGHRHPSNFITPKLAEFMHRLLPE